jgi:hypothetical protein
MADQLLLSLKRDKEKEGDRLAAPEVAKKE